MNPYEILGVSTLATDAEIKLAYRKLARQFHPDVSETVDQEAIARINEAYAILSDPIRKGNYDSGPSSSFELEEDPVERYKQEFKKRKREEAKKATEQALKREQQAFRFFRIVAFPILFFAIFLIVDDVLPTQTFQEVAEKGWQDRLGGSKRSQGRLVSYMQTEHFTLVVPAKIHIHYDYFSDKKEMLTIKVSPIQKIPKSVSLVHGNAYIEFDVDYTLYSGFPWHHILFLSSLFTIVFRNYSRLTHMLCYLPLLLLAITLLRLYAY